MKARDGTTTHHRYRTAFIISAGKIPTIAFTEVRNDESRGPAIERARSLVDDFPMFVDRILMD